MMLRNMGLANSKYLLDFFRDCLTDRAGALGPPGLTGPSGIPVETDIVKFLWAPFGNTPQSGGSGT